MLELLLIFGRHSLCKRPNLYIIFLLKTNKLANFRYRKQLLWGSKRAPQDGFLSGDGMNFVWCNQSIKLSILTSLQRTYYRRYDRFSYKQISSNFFYYRFRLLRALFNPIFHEMYPMKCTRIYHQNIIEIEKKKNQKHLVIKSHPHVSRFHVLNNLSFKLEETNHDRNMDNLASHTERVSSTAGK